MPIFNDLNLKKWKESEIDKHFIEGSIGIYKGLTRDEIKNEYPDLYVKNITGIFDDVFPKGETIDNEVAN